MVQQLGEHNACARPAGHPRDQRRVAPTWVGRACDRKLVALAMRAGDAAEATVRRLGIEQVVDYYRDEVAGATPQPP